MILKIGIIRHAKTEGNYNRQYIGITDESLCQKGILEVIKRIDLDLYPKAQFIVTSPMKRCIETMELIYKNQEYKIVAEFAECNFGIFEGLTYEELKENPHYIDWINADGKGEIPEGENSLVFKNRVCKAFEKVVNEIIQNKIENTAIISHGGSLMAIMEKYSEYKGNFYSWQIKNCEGYKVLIDTDLWYIKKEFIQYEKF